MITGPNIKPNIANDFFGATGLLYGEQTMSHSSPFTIFFPILLQHCRPLYLLRQTLDVDA